MRWINRVGEPVCHTEQTYLMFMYTFLSSLEVDMEVELGANPKQANSVLPLIFSTPRPQPCGKHIASFEQIASANQ